MRLIDGGLSRLASIFLVMGLLFAPVTAQASRVSPMIVELKPTGRGAIARVQLTNDSQRDIAYEVQMMRGDISPDGQLSLTPADEQFIIFPPQAIVESLSQQVFRIQYVGTEAIEQSQIYYLSIKQIPVAFDEGQNQVQVVVNYNVLVNVVPDGTAAIPTIASLEYVEREKSMDDIADEDRPAVIPTENGLLVDVGNDGNRFFFAGRSKWNINARTTSGEPFERSYTGDEMTEFIGAAIVAPGKNRVFFIPTESALASDSLQLTIEP